MIEHKKQPTRKTCGQTVCAMLAGVAPEVVIADLGDRGTRGIDLVRWLRPRGFALPDRPVRFRFDRDRAWSRAGLALPPTAIVRVDFGVDRRHTHWILWAEGRYWDPDAPIVNGRDDGHAWLARGGRIYSILPVVTP